MNIRSIAIAALLAGPMSCISSCTRWVAMEEFAIQSRGESGARLSMPTLVAAWSQGATNTSIILSDIGLDALASERPSGIVVHLDVLWTPHPGKTPIDPTATNFVCRILVLSDGEAGLYGGGGFGWPKVNSSKGSLSLDVTGCSFSLLEHTSGFKDLLTPGEIRGVVQAKRQDSFATRFQRAASQAASNRFGAVHWVQDDRPSESPGRRTGQSLRDDRQVLRCDTVGPDLH